MKDAILEECSGLRAPSCSQESGDLSINTFFQSEMDADYIYYDHEIPMTNI